MTGEGIAQAIETGVLAADAVSAGGDPAVVAARYRRSVGERGAARPAAAVDPRWRRHHAALSLHRNNQPERIRRPRYERRRDRRIRVTGKLTSARPAARPGPPVEHRFGVGHCLQPDLRALRHRRVARPAAIGPRATNGARPAGDDVQGDRRGVLTTGTNATASSHAHYRRDSTTDPAHIERPLHCSAKPGDARPMDKRTWLRGSAVRALAYTLGRTLGNSAASRRTRRRDQAARSTREDFSQSGTWSLR